MFRFTERLSSPGGTDSKRYLKRAALFAAGLVLLWTAIQLIPTTPAEPPVYSDDSGSVASSEQVRPAHRGPRLFTFGNLAALLLLGGGGAFAVYMHRRSSQGGRGTSHIETIGELPMGQGQQLRLVRCGGEVLLIGATSHEITLLRDFDPDLFDEPATAHRDASGERGLTRSADARSAARHSELAHSSNHPDAIRSARHSDDDDPPAETHDERSSVRQGSGAAPHRPHPSSTHFADVLRQYAGRYVNIQSNGRAC